MNVLITGGAGFIGSHLVEECLKLNHKVIVIDNLSNGRLENIALYLDEITFIKKDICHFDKIESYFENIDWVFHLAALADIVPSVESPKEYHHANVEGTLSVLEAARKHKVKKTLYAASSSCYGMPDSFPTREDDPKSPQYPYALTKMVAEQYVEHWGQLYKLPVISLRLFNVYGPRSRTNSNYGAAFGTFLAQKIAKKPFTVVGDGKQTRDFIFVTDVVNAFLTAAKSKLSNKIYNVGTGDPQSVNRLVSLLKGEIDYIPKRPGEPQCTQADISQITKDLNWKPIVSFEAGINIMLQNIDYWKKAKLWDKLSIEYETRPWFKYLGE